MFGGALWSSPWFLAPFWGWSPASEWMGGLTVDFQTGTSFFFLPFFLRGWISRNIHPSPGAFYGTPMKIWLSPRGGNLTTKHFRRQIYVACAFFSNFYFYSYFYWFQFYNICFVLDRFELGKGSVFNPLVLWVVKQNLLFAFAGHGLKPFTLTQTIFYFLFWFLLVLLFYFFGCQCCQVVLAFWRQFFN